MIIKPLLTVLCLTVALSVFSGCGEEPKTPAVQSSPAANTANQPNTQNGAQAGNLTGNQTAAQNANQTGSPSSNAGTSTSSTGKATDPAPSKPGIKPVATNPESITVLVNKQQALPDSYEPKDLVYPNVPFTFKEQIDKRKMRKEAAAALENLFEGAKKSGINLAGVSAYRSYATQKTLYNNYVKQDGEEKAKTYSAVPGHSEHETGLAIDVSGSDGKCAAQNCFAVTKEAKWLDSHAAEYGFIIRYPDGKEAITGYQYEPWHLRYVGIQLSKELTQKNLTLEEYFNAVPVQARK
ncbi:D-alanyl-D-alanine carboxypeptidase [Paenibacillus sp. 1_12]|uniref:M15 family metallopeptidase n=1 Tax=Paenibacillus sp. 1_12 TaxID=1566278 RepID=UPI0008ECC1C4|nr:M15 family metallopeptidase [Paenibacillus sp. 1_12]SFL75354.1 D-alanyl-D-alanine carboxypeptidase [Paenibacillus sp. 1_12]